MQMLRRQLPGSTKDWNSVAGDLGLNSVMSASMDWYFRNIPQAKPVIRRYTSHEEYETIYDHPLLSLLKQPLPSVPGTLVWCWTAQDYKFIGNAYLRKLRLNNGDVVGLQYLPQDMVAPVGDGQANPLTHYIYDVDGRRYSFEVDDIIHWRYGRDPLDLRLGRSPVQSVLREIATDNAASTTAFALLDNGAIPSLFVGPDGNNMTTDMSPEEAKILKRQIQRDFTGDNAGGVVVMSGPYKMDKVSYTPQEMDLGSIRRTPEERICAAMGINPMVLGLGSGLERSTYSNYERAQQAAWEDGMIPMLNSLAEILTTNLIPDFPDLTESDIVVFDTTNVKALADDLDAESQRADRLYKSGIIDRATAKRIAHIEVNSEDEGVYFGQSTEIPDPNPVIPVRSFHDPACQCEACEFGGARYPLPFS